MAARESLKLKFLQYLGELVELVFLEREIKFSCTGRYIRILYANVFNETILVNAFVKKKILRLSLKLHVNR